MRKVDKKINLKKVNLLLEERYIKNKRFINENLTSDIDYVKSEFEKLEQVLRNGSDEFYKKEKDIIYYTGKPDGGTYAPGVGDAFYWAEAALDKITYIDEISIENGELHIPSFIERQGYKSDLLKKYDEIKDLDVIKLQYLLYRLDRSWFHFTSTESTTHGSGGFLFTDKYSLGECSCEVNIYNKFKEMINNWLMNEYKPKYETLQKFIIDKIK